MTITITHKKVATYPDEPSAEINKAEWNDTHIIEGALESVTHDNTLVGAGTNVSPLGINLTNANTWTGTQNFAEPSMFGGTSAEASVHASVITATIQAPASLTSSIIWGGQYPFGSGSKSYQVYSSKTVNGVQFFSSSGAGSSFSEPAQSDGNPTGGSSTIQYGSGGFTASGLTTTYDIYAIYYSDGQVSVAPTTTSVTDDNSSNSYNIDVSWSAPISGGNRFYIFRNASEYRIVNGLGFTDDNTGWTAGSLSLASVQYDVELTSATVDDAVSYRYLNSTTGTFVDGGVGVMDDASWASGSTVTPTSADYISVISEGDTYLCRAGSSKLLSYFGHSGAGQQTGNIISALSNYGLVVSGSIQSSDMTDRAALSGTSNQVIVSAGGSNVLLGTNITLSLPQNIHTSATPQFSRMGLGVAASATQSLSVTIGTSTHKGFVLKGATSQSGNLIELQNSAGTVLTTFTSTGGMILVAGTATAGTAPLKMTSGTLLTTAEAGGVEFLTDKFYGTITTSASRKEFMLADVALTSGRVPFSTTNGRQTDSANFTYTTNRLSPTYITLAAGATAAGSAPIKFTSGALMTTAEAGGMEFLTDKAYLTITTGASRKEFTLNDNALTSGRVSYSTTNGRQTDSANLLFNGTNMTLANALINTASAGGTTEGMIWNDSTQKALAVYQSGVKQMQVGALFTQTADQTVTNTVTETTILGTGVGTKTLPANFFVAGKTIRIRVGGVYSTPAASTPSLIIKVKYGSTVIATVTTTGLLSGATNLEFDGEVAITCRTTGASGSVMVHGDIEYATGVLGTSSVDPLNNAGATTTINTTTSNALDITVQWDTATATRIAKSTITTIEVLN